VLSRRGEGAAVTMRASTAACAESFAKGLESFLGEARLLASFDHPALIKVHRFWRDNGTAYMAMPYYPGQTLKDVRLQMLAVPAEPWLTGLVSPLLGALEVLHRQGVFHRDIAPDNILILPDGRPVLLDFGSARRAVASGSQWFTAHLKPQFAPLEQYAEDESLGQGPWTDLYSLGATLYFVISGRAPVASVVRAVRDTLPALSTAPPASLPGLSPRFLGTIDWTLALSPHDRPQDVAVPGFSNVDFSLMKNTKLTEEVSLQFRAEVFDVFNHPSFGQPGRVVGTPVFGRIINTRFPTGDSGSSRQLQFALKLMF